MSKVCVVIEHWNNEESYENAAWGDKILAVAGNPSTAENIIVARKRELMKRAVDFDKLCRVYKPCLTSKDYFDSLRLQFFGYETPFTYENDGMHLFNQVAFYWKIEDHEIES